MTAETHLRTVGAFYVLFCGAWLIAEDAAAQNESAYAPAQYQVFVDQALAEYEIENFAEARALFLKAHEVFPNARALRGIGMAEFELKNYSESIARLEQALVSSVRPLTGALREHTESLLARAKAFVTRYELLPQPLPEGTRVVVDGVPMALADGQSLTLTVGEHVLEIRAPGYRAEKRALSVRGGSQEPIVLKLRETERTRPGPALATSAQPVKDERDTLWESPWLWTGVGAVIAGGVVAAILLSNQDDSTADPVPGDIGGVIQARSRR